MGLFSKKSKDEALNDKCSDDQKLVEKSLEIAAGMGIGLYGSDDAELKRRLSIRLRR